MTPGRTIGLLLVLLSLLGCAGQSQRVPQPTADKERPEQKKETAYPTFTYRPGG